MPAWLNTMLNSIAASVSACPWWQVLIILIVVLAMILLRNFNITEWKKEKRAHLEKLLQQYCPHAEKIEGSDPPEFSHRADVSITHVSHGKYANRKWICLDCNKELPGIGSLHTIESTYRKNPKAFYETLAKYRNTLRKYEKG